MPDPDSIEAPITVSASPVPAAVATLIRQGLLAACAYAVAQGWFGQSVADQLIPIGVGVATLAYGQIKGWVLHRTAAKMAAILPDTIAVTK
jgi:hypothetical protein